MDIKEKLNKEMELCQKNRYNFILRKITYITALFGVSLIKIDGFSLAGILYIVPLICIGFDIYILIEDFKVKRIGEFLKGEGDPIQQKWEKWVSNHGNPYATYAAPFFTLVALLGATLLLFKDTNFQNINVRENIINGGWFLVILMFIFWLWWRSTHTRQIFKQKSSD